MPDPRKESKIMSFVLVVISMQRWINFSGFLLLSPPLKPPSPRAAFDISSLDQKSFGFPSLKISPLSTVATAENHPTSSFL